MLLRYNRMNTNNNQKREKLDIPDETILGREHTPYEKRILKMRLYRQTNKAKLSKYRCEYYKNNRENIREYSRTYMKERLDNNPALRVKHNERTKEHRLNKDMEKQEPTEDELTEKTQIKEQKKKLRMLLKQQAYQEKVIQDSIDLSEQIREIESHIINSKK